MSAAANQHWPQPGLKTAAGTHYLLKGPKDGRIVLCIHGIGAYSACFDKLAAALVNEGYQVLQYDLDAHPPAQPSKLVLLSPAGLMNPGPIKPLRALSCMHGLIKKVLKSGQEGAWKQVFVVKKGDNFEAMMQMQRDQLHNNPHSFDAFFQSALHFPLYGIDEQASRVGKLPLSTLIMWGKQDQAVPMKPSLSRWEQHFAQSVQTEVWDKAGHGFFLEQPERAAASIIAFLKPTA
mmetsp:Transcript_23571/g.56232  ORF Transcript_23571/g.56232 Transcript_23571/m.56232 type:complete len:235 (+) Transcript_23571:56-760(+)